MGAHVAERSANETSVLRLIGLAGELSGALGRVAALAEMLAAEATASGGDSTLNTDGSPVQLLASATATAVAYRLIADPGFGQNRAAGRLAAAHRMLAGVLELTHCGAMRDSIELMLASCLPAPGSARWNELDRGVAWIGTALDRDGVAVYVDASHGERSRAWSRVRNWLTTALPAGADAGAVLDTLARHGEVAGVAVEGASPERARLKLYWRLCEPVRLDQLGIGPLASQALHAFLLYVLGDSAPPLRALTASIAFDAASGELTDAKLDLCGCPSCLDLSRDRLTAVTSACCGAFGLRLPALVDVIARGEASGALLGMGCDRHGTIRLNLYAAPPPC